MANKINIKLILELADKGMSGRSIAALHHISHHSITAVLKRMAELGITSDDARKMNDAELYRKFFPDKYDSQAA